jgi:uncharacterized protein YdaU (DUF1376 family)
MSDLGLSWYKRQPAAYLGGVQGLTAKQHAVYSVVLDLIYVHGGYINNDPRWIAGWISDMGSSAVRTAIESLIECGKLQLEEGRLTQKRAKTEVKTERNQRETREKLASFAGKHSAKSRARSNEINDLVERDVEPNKIREDKRIKRVTKVTPKSEDDPLFDMAWSEYPRKVGKGQARKAWNAAIKKEDPVKILEALEKHSMNWDGKSPEYIPHLSTWLNGERWLDDLDEAEDFWNNFDWEKKA